VDDEVVFRQLTCPGCLTAVYSGVVPAAHVDHVTDVSRFAASRA
jgi:N-methylhydantoinase B